MKRIVLTTLLTVAGAGTAWTAPMSSASMFAESMRYHFSVGAPMCWKQKNLPPKKNVERIITGILAAADRFWPGSDAARYRLMALMLSEGGGNSRNTAKPGEESYGVCCVKLPTARWVCHYFSIPCPRSSTALKQKLIEDIEWSTLVSAGALWLYDSVQGYDEVRGLLMYKYGATGFGRAVNGLAVDKPGQPVTELMEWKKFMRGLAYAFCVRDRIMAPAPSDCGCLAPETPQ